MTRFFHVLLRKFKTLRLTLQKCTNWPAIVLAKAGLSSGPEFIVLRDGFRLAIMPPLKNTWGEIFEPAIADLYGITQSDPDLIIDVGANIGAFACRAAFLHRRATIHAFEPSKAHAELLRKNIGLNRLENVVLHTAPVTKDGRRVVFSHLGSGGSSGIFLQEGRTGSVDLQSVSLAEIDFGQFNSAFIKLDCEGAEGEIIEWICANLGKLPRQIAIACEYHHWCPVPQHEIVRTLNAHGFVAEQKALFDEPYIFAATIK